MVHDNFIFIFCLCEEWRKRAKQGSLFLLMLDESLTKTAKLNGLKGRFYKIPVRFLIRYGRFSLTTQLISR
jgi:hypothetical protein